MDNKKEGVRVDPRCDCEELSNKKGKKKPAKPEVTAPPRWHADLIS